MRSPLVDPTARHKNICIGYRTATPRLGRLSQTCDSRTIRDKDNSYASCDVPTCRFHTVKDRTVSTPTTSHSHTRTQTRTLSHTHTHTHTHKHKRCIFSPEPRTHTHTHPPTHTYVHTHILPPTRSHIDLHVLPTTHPHPHPHPHPPTPTHTHTPKPTNMLAAASSRKCPSLLDFCAARLESGSRKSYKVSVVLRDTTLRHMTLRHTTSRHVRVTTQSFGWAQDLSPFLLEVLVIVWKPTCTWCVS